MTPEFDPIKHERDVQESWRRIGKYALFDEMIDYYLDGDCSFEEAVQQYQHDASEMDVTS